ncbi:MAG: hypothetical protein CMM58_11230 [Rhodospirillaceae bacterium]|nr:hypothetical protein [Rhodospirillaceae bacterium]|tara:strand:- start:1430 stop:1729 length:300 start_codon:yes stop_codon:yes gene_type:complete
MSVEIGALLSKDFGQEVLEKMNGFEGVKTITVESGRSSDLFEEKQFGAFGEASIVSIIADNEQKDKIFDAVFELCELHGHQSGLIFMTPEIIKSTLQAD